MSILQKFAVFILDSQRYALAHTVVEKVVRAVEITPLPKTPKEILGVINVHGAVIPVLNIRWLCGLPEHDVDPKNYIIICHIHSQSVAFVVDDIQGLIEFLPTALSATESVMPEIKYVNALMKHTDGLILIFNHDYLLNQRL